MYRPSPKGPRSRCWTSKTSVLCICIVLRFLFLDKEFKSLDEQLTILKSRGISISKDYIVKDYLLTNNYYNIINGYSKPFLRQREEYLFDEEIKRLLFHGILLAEHHIKSVFAYRFAEAYPDKKPSLNPPKFSRVAFLCLRYPTVNQSKCSA